MKYMGRQEREENRMYVYWLSSVESVGNRTIQKLLNHFGSGKGIYHAREEELAVFLNRKQMECIKKSRREWNPEKAYWDLQKKGIRFLLQQDEEYPEKLRNIPDAPCGMFCLGNLPREDVLSVAIIGARECSEYGKYVAKGLGDALGKQGVQVISGMARGVDGISQQAALDAGGVSYGVLGCGVDICYPASNRAFYEELVKVGGVLSPFPPGTQPRPQNFPPRNRIVSGLADVIVVVEARAKSGTLITVDMALEQGREVYVVPGRITDRLSDGCNRLLKQGAAVLLSPYDFLEDMAQRCGKGGIQKQEGEGEPDGICSMEKRSPFISRLDVSQEMRRVYEALDYEPQSVEQITERLQGQMRIDPMQVNTILLSLSMMQVASQLSPGHFSLKV